MRKSYKICLIIAIFFACTSVALAQFNYDSANNYFLLESILKSDGDYILVGDAFEELGEIAESFAISNNLILLKQDSLFTDSSLWRQIGIDAADNQSFFKTFGIDVQSSISDFEILTSGQQLDIFAERIYMNQDFNVNNGISFTDDVQTPSKYSLYANKVLTTYLRLLSASVLSIPTDKTLKLTAAGSATAASIQINGKQICEKLEWTVTDDFNTNPTADGKYSQDGAITSCGTNELKCCSQGYYVFDIDATAGQMICCMATLNRP